MKICGYSSMVEFHDVKLMMTGRFDSSYPLNAKVAQLAEDHGVKTVAVGGSIPPLRSNLNNNNAELVQ